MKLMLNGKEVSGMGHYVMAGDIKDATAEDSNVLSGKSYYNNNGKREGTMPNRGGMSAELAAGGSVSIPEGYHNGEGKVAAKDIATIVSENGAAFGDATAADVASGKTFTSASGVKVAGTGKLDTTVILKSITPPTSSEQVSFSFNSSNSYIRIKDVGGKIHIIPISTLTTSNNYVILSCSANYANPYIKIKLASTTTVLLICADINRTVSQLVSSIEEVNLG